jgi:hypothetical protein
MRHRHLFGLLIALAGCPQPSPAPPTPEASDGSESDCVMACAALSAAGCSVGAQSDCPAFLTRDLGIGKVPNPTTQKPMTCADVAGVRTKANAQALGFVCAPDGG